MTPINNYKNISDTTMILSENNADKEIFTGVNTKKISINRWGGPNYIPVNNYQDFTADVYLYYNQYYASPYVTQQRRIIRNYINNNNSIKKANKNPFINNKNIKFNFVYGEAETYMVVQYADKSINIYIRIGNGWCLQRHFDKINCKELADVLKQYVNKNY